jgi:DNA polymerase-4
MFVLHLDIDAFFAGVEQVLDPRLRGRPVIVGSGVIASCSYEARRFGLHAGMSLRDARRLCREGVFLKGRQPIYRCFASRIFEILRETAPSVDTYLDEAFCDLSGMERLLGDPLRLGEAVRDRVLRATGLSVTVGLGPSRMAAKIAGKTVKPGGVRCVRTEAELASLIAPMEATVIPGVGRKVAEVLRDLNVRTVTDLRALPKPALTALFGANGRALFDRARGRDTRAVTPAEIPKSISRETTFHAETADRAEIEGMLQYLCGRASRAARTLGLSARTLAVKIAYADFRREKQARSFPHPTDLDDEIVSSALALLRSLYTRRANLRLVGMALSNFVPRASTLQLDLFRGAEPARRARLGTALDRIRDRFGHAAVVDGRSIRLLGKLQQDDYGYVLRTPCLTK